MAGGQSVANRRVKARAGVGMELIHPGGERTVTGSCHLLRVSGVNILVDSYQRHHRLLDYHGPGVIVAGSGMCSGGRIIDHLKEGIGERRNDILFVGYQAAGTPGRDILKYHRRPGAYVYLNGEKYDIRARIHQLNGYSAHADCHDLIVWVKAMAEKPGKIKLVHGDSEAQKALTRRLVDTGCVVV